MFFFQPRNVHLLLISFILWHSSSSIFSSSFPLTWCASQFSIPCISLKPWPILPGGLVHTRLAISASSLASETKSCRSSPTIRLSKAPLQNSAMWDWPSRLGARLEVARLATSWHCWSLYRVVSGWRLTFPEIFCHHCTTEQAGDGDRRGINVPKSPVFDVFKGERGHLQVHLHSSRPCVYTFLDISNHITKQTIPQFA